LVQKIGQVTLNRLTSKTYPDTTSANYFYDLASRVYQVNDPTGGYTIAYDNMGRPIGTATQYAFLPGKTYTAINVYDSASNRTTLQTEPVRSLVLYRNPVRLLSL
jgi:YD repeat-containing protein